MSSSSRSSPTKTLPVNWVITFIRCQKPSDDQVRLSEIWMSRSINSSRAPRSLAWAMAARISAPGSMPKRCAMRRWKECMRKELSRERRLALAHDLEDVELAPGLLVLQVLVARLAEFDADGVGLDRLDRLVRVADALGRDVGSADQEDLAVVERDLPHGGGKVRGRRPPLGFSGHGSAEA